MLFSYIPLLQCVCMFVLVGVCIYMHMLEQLFILLGWCDWHWWIVSSRMCSLLMIRFMLWIKQTGRHVVLEICVILG
jgi:hypothetical protein